MTISDRFEWSLGDKLPVLRPHSAAKLKLIGDYLNRYFDAVMTDPRADRLQISLVDGFSGGGAFEDRDGTIVSGTPLLMLESVEAARMRLNANRRKKLLIDARYYFVDRSRSTIEFLRHYLIERGYEEKLDKSIFLFGGIFQDHALQIQRDILSKARAGRSIFLLDQLGYNQVPLQICRELFEQLPRSEIILTFAIDWLIDYMSANASFLTAVSPVELTEDQIRRFLHTKGTRGHRYLVQRLIIRQLQARIGFPFFTPFFIRSPDANRDLWLIHASKHPTARNVMTSSHWAIQNASIHQGRAGLNMLGFDPGWEEALPLDFIFDGNAEAQIEEALMDDLPKHIERLDEHGPITFDAFQRSIANETAARIDHIETVVMQLHQERDIEILTPTGKLKKTGTRVLNTDRLQLTREPIFPGFSLPNPKNT